MFGDVLAVLLPVAGVFDGIIQGRLRHGNGHQSDQGAPGLQQAQHLTQSLARRGQQVGRRDAHVAEEQLCRRLAVQDHLGNISAGVAVVPVHQQQGQPLFLLVILHLRHADIEIRVMAVGNPLFFPVDHEVIAVAPGAGPDLRNVGPYVRFTDADGAELFTLSDGLQVRPGQIAGNTGEQLAAFHLQQGDYRQVRRSAGQFLEQQAVSDHIEAETAVFLRHGSVDDAERLELPDQRLHLFPGNKAVLVRFQRRPDLGFGKAPERIQRHLLLLCR